MRLPHGTQVVWITPMNSFEIGEVLTVLIDKGSQLVVTSSYHEDFTFKPRTVVVRAQVRVFENGGVNETQ